MCLSALFTCCEDAWSTIVFSLLNPLFVNVGPANKLGILYDAGFSGEMPFGFDISATAKKERGGAAGHCTRIPCILFLPSLAAADATDDEMIPICSARVFGHSLALAAAARFVPRYKCCRRRLSDRSFGCYICWPAAQCPPIKLPSFHSSAVPQPKKAPDSLAPRYRV